MSDCFYDDCSSCLWLNLKMVKSVLEEVCLDFWAKHWDSCGEVSTCTPQQLCVPQYKYTRYSGNFLLVLKDIHWKINQWLIFLNCKLCLRKCACKESLLMMLPYKSRKWHYLPSTPSAKSSSLLGFLCRGPKGEIQHCENQKILWQCASTVSGPV